MSRKVTVEVTEDGYVTVVNVDGVLYQRRMDKMPLGAKEKEVFEGYRPMRDIEFDTDISHEVVEAIEFLEDGAYALMNALYFEE